MKNNSLFLQWISRILKGRKNWEKKVRKKKKKNRKEQRELYGIWRKTCLFKQITFQKFGKYNKIQKITEVLRKFNRTNVLSNGKNR